MSKSWDLWQQELASRLQDPEQKLGPADRDVCLRQAILQRFSKDRPQELVSDVAGNGTADLPLPTHASGTFDEIFSKITQIEYPIGAVPETLLTEGDDWGMYRTPSALKVRLVSARPTASENVRMTWSAQHKDDGSTVPDSDFEAVVDWAASLALELLAAGYAKTGDSTLGADTVNYRSKSQEYVALSKVMKRRYLNHFGMSEGDIGQGGVKPAIGIGEVDGSVAGSGADRLTHPRRWR